MIIEVAEIAVASVGVVCGVWAVFYQQRKAQEKTMSDAMGTLQKQIDALKKEKVDESDMKEYVQLWTAPITQSLDHLVEEQKATRKLMEKIYHEGRKA